MELAHSARRSMLSGVGAAIALGSKRAAAQAPGGDFLVLKLPGSRYGIFRVSRRTPQMQAVAPQSPQPSE